MGAQSLLFCIWLEISEPGWRVWEDGWRLAVVVKNRNETLEWAVYKLALLVAHFQT